MCSGEFGADRIYAGQMAVLGKSSVGPVIQVIIKFLNSIKILSGVFNFI